MASKRNERAALGDISRATTQRFGCVHLFAWAVCADIPPINRAAMPTREGPLCPPPFRFAVLLTRLYSNEGIAAADRANMANDDPPIVVVSSILGG